MADNKHIIYSAEDMHRYFSGKMDAVEMHAMEKAALSDPLLADAMEGYHALPAVDDEKEFAAVQKQLDELKEKISGKTISIKKYDNSWWKVAAAVLLLIGSVFAYFQITKNNKQENPIAKKDVISNTPSIKTTFDSNISNKQTDTAIKNSGMAIAEMKQDKITISNQQAAVSKAESLPVNNAVDSIATGNSNEGIAQVEAKEINPAPSLTRNKTAIQPQFENTSADNNQLADKAIANDEVYAKKKSLFKSNDLKASNKNAVNFTGKVTDANNNAIPYANLIINTKKQTRTDAKGFFNLSLSDSVIRLDVTANNYYPATSNITANNFAGIVLNVKRNTLKKKAFTDTLTRSIVQILYKAGVEPKDGWIKYQAYLTEQLSNSQYDDGRMVTGETIVRFEIDRNLQPTNFMFEKSINQDVNDALETFILTGPEWRIAESGGLPGIVELKIIF